MPLSKVRVKSESQLTRQCLGIAGRGLNQKKVRCWLFASAHTVCTAAFPQPRKREDQHLIWILYPFIGVFSMKSIVKRPTSWLPLVIPALQTGRLSFGGWLDYKNKFQNSFGCTTRPPSKKKRDGRRERGEEGRERGREQKALRRKRLVQSEYEKTLI